MTTVQVAGGGGHIPNTHTVPPLNPQQGQVVSGQILTSADYAMIGGELARAGLSRSAISDMMGRIERTVDRVARTAARECALELLADITVMVQETHRASAMEVHRQISNKTLGFGGLAHRACAQIAYNVAESMPRQAPPPAQPILGSLR